MPAQADIIVSSPDSTEIKLVVETKLHARNHQQIESQLKNFMLQMRCPLALLVTPQRLWVYLDRFTSYSSDSIQLLGEFGVEGLIDWAAGGSEAAFENAVQSWLEGLSADLAGVRDPNLRTIINHYILPAVETGVIRAAGPRDTPRSL